MAGFALCERCRSEYHDPGDRRYHAQPIACEVCGPRLSLLTCDGSTVAVGDEALRECTRSLADGGIIALKGLGGFHIACLPEDAPVLRLRERKKRPAKPFALMTSDDLVAEGLVTLSPYSRQLLNSPRRPIVICPRKPLSGISPHVAPYQDSLGIMLPYTPLHHLIMEELPVLVMTSERRAGIRKGRSGVWLTFPDHDRPITAKIDTRWSLLRARFILIRRGGMSPPGHGKRDAQVLLPGPVVLFPDQEVDIRPIFGDLKQLDLHFTEKT